MRRVAICSNMRADSEYEIAYYLQILGLSRKTFHIASVNVIYDREPESSTWLRELLASRGIPVCYEIEVASGGVEFLQLEQKARQWATIGNQCLELALSRDDKLTHVAVIEADLSYPYDTLDVLLERDKPIIAPMIYLNNTFYDGWGFRGKNGEKISAVAGVTPVRSHQPVELNSVGSFVLFEIAVFESGIRFKGEYENGLLVGVCEDAGKIGLSTFMDPTISISHPVTAWREQIWNLDTIQIKVDGVVAFKQANLPDILMAGPFEEIVRPWFDLHFDKHFDPRLPRKYTIVRNVKNRLLHVTVDIVSVTIVPAPP